MSATCLGSQERAEGNNRCGGQEIGARRDGIHCDRGFEVTAGQPAHSLC